MTTNKSISARLRRVVPAAFITATAALAGATLGDPATAYAARYWDIEKYDFCIASGIGEGLDAQEEEALKARCCWASGGDWNTATNDCQAPPAEEGGGAPPGPGMPAEVVAPTLDVAPPRPPIRDPGVITETLTPASVNPG